MLQGFQGGSFNLRVHLKENFQKDLSPVSGILDSVDCEQGQWIVLGKQCVFFENWIPLVILEFSLPTLPVSIYF